LIEQWRGRLEAMRGLRVGINWRGNPITRYRDIPIELFESLGQLPGVTLISLQKGEGGQRSEVGGPRSEVGGPRSEVGGPRSENRGGGEAGSAIADLGEFDTASGAFMDTAGGIVKLRPGVYCGTAGSA